MLPFPFHRFHSTSPSFSFTPGIQVHDKGNNELPMMEAFDADVFDNAFENNKCSVKIALRCGHNVSSKNTTSGSIKRGNFKVT